MGATPLASSLATTPKKDLAAFPVEMPLPLTDIMRISFRRGGDKDFYNSLKKALLRKAWVVGGLCHELPVIITEDRMIPQSEDSLGVVRNLEVSQPVARSGIRTPLRYSRVLYTEL